MLLSLPGNGNSPPQSTQFHAGRRRSDDSGGFNVCIIVWLLKGCQQVQKGCTKKPATVFSIYKFPAIAAVLLHEMVLCLQYAAYA